MRTVKEFAIRRSLNFDTVVIGGGTTGIAAAVASARNGAKTLLVESNGFLGGNGASIPSWMGFHSRSGEAVIGGIALELVQEMQRREGASRIYPDPICGSVCIIQPALLKIVAADFVSRAGVDILLHTRFAGVERIDKKITAVYLWGGEGLIEVTLENVIDCTDAGFVAREAGETLFRGRSPDHKVQVASWTFEIDNIDFPELAAYFTAFPDDMRPFPLDDAPGHVRQILQQDGFVIGAFHRLIRQAEKDGMCLPRSNMPGVIFPRQGRFVTVASRVENVDPASSASHSRAEIEGAAQAELWLRFLRQYVPGFAHCRISGSCSSIGVRETCHLQGAATLSGENLLRGDIPEDSIALGAYHLDVHSPDHRGIETRFPRIYGIPFGALCPLRTANLLVAGRAVSATHDALASTRVIPISMAEGEAAGTAAALAVRAGIPAVELPAEQLRAVLQKNGAILSPGAPDQALSADPPAENPFRPQTEKFSLENM